jgi:nucleotide-binding universal stress UspA family protein
MTASQSTMVVGVSGSRASLRALRWAAQEASRREAGLEIVLAWQPQQTASYAVQVGRADHRQEQEAACRKLAAILSSIIDGELPDSLTANVVEGLAERVLAERSVGTAMLVLGSTSSPTLSGRSIGPVIRSCISRAVCPVVVVGPEQEASDGGKWPGEGPRVSVVGIRPASGGRTRDLAGTTAGTA